ncbi:MAG TPA: zinc-binding alcohol dehydrogenase family protein [Acidimicrobiales bacterium]|nr:zinc-binding alcohol dehydrogenase family protein [Acidimicrobiales bacterium]
MSTTPAVRLLRHGEPLALEEIELPAPGEGEVLLEVAYCGVNPIDRYVALGLVAPDGPLPRTLGGEASGLVGGRPVVVTGHGLGATRDGLWAGRAVVPAEALVDVPTGVDLQRAAAIGIAGRTAWRTAVDVGALDAADRVLVLGASGGVGSMVVSLCRHRGATVAGQTADPSKSAWLRERGADEVVVAADGASLAADADLRRLAPTLVLDCLGGTFTAAAIELLAPGGRIVLFGTSAGAHGEVPLQMLYRKGLRMLGYGGLVETPESVRRGIAEALGAVASGDLEVVVDSVLPLGAADEAFTRLVERRVLGKLLLDASA